MLMEQNADDAPMATVQIKSSKEDSAIGIANSQASHRKMIPHLLSLSLELIFTEMDMLLDSM